MTTKKEEPANRSFKELDSENNLMGVASFLLPSRHFVQIWQDKRADDLWPWEVTLLEKNENLRFASGLADSYHEALRSVELVVSLWLSSGHTLADEREVNRASGIDIEEDIRRLGFPGIR